MLYLANPSLQRYVFMYREPKNNLVQHVSLASGEQAVIGQGWSAAQQRRVIEQLEKFGARDAAETHRPMAKFAGLIYRDQGVIETDEIEMAHASEVQTREERSAAEATKAALGFDRAVRKRSREHPAARTTEVEVAQELPRGQRPKGNETRFSISVDPEGRGDVKLPV